MDKSAGLVRASNFNFLSICMWKLLFSQGGTWAFVRIIYLYCNRPRKPQREPCNVRGHRATALPQDTGEVVRGSQDGLMPQERWMFAHTLAPWEGTRQVPAMLTQVLGLSKSGDCKANRLNPHGRAHSTAWTDRHTGIPTMCRPTGQPPGRAGALTGPAAKSSSLRPGMKRPWNKGIP